ncbi:hypothetical protein [Agromyces salentinus]|uniref:Polysaccharide chain length determinant N-terminal domain-containing protein n=1 Tax=Agromyces salentinus TaxID=269421 RepID=A0ABP4YUL7_9MICO|nr:hypothetical protein [Agromyces salentinus]
MTAPGYLQVFQQRWGVIVTSVVACVGLAALATAVIPPTYTAKATLFLSVQSPVASLAELSQFSLARVGSYPDLVYSEDVLEHAAAELGTDASAGKLASLVSASNPTGTVLIEVMAEGPTGADAAGLANAAAAGLAEEVSEIENSPGSTYTVELDVRIPAQAPGSPSAPQRTVILGLGLVSGLALGAVLALTLAQLDTRLRTAADVRRVSGLPVFGQFRRGRRRVGGDSPSLDPEADGYIEAALNIRQANGGVVPSFVVLAPTSPTAAPSQTRLGLARAYAETGRDALLVETTSEPGSAVPAIADLAERPGLGELIASGSTELSGSVRPIDVSPGAGEVWALPRGLEVPSELVTERWFPILAEAMVADTDVVILQASTLTRPLDLHTVVSLADVVVVVARYGSTREAELARIVTDLRLEGVRPIGVVFVDVPQRHHTDLAAGWRSEDFAAGPGRPPEAGPVPSTSPAARPKPPEPADGKSPGRT